MSIARSIATLALVAAAAVSASAQQPPAPPASAPPPQPAFDVQVTTPQAVHAVVLPMKGSYMQHPDAFGRLGGYLSGRGLTPAGPPFGRYFSDPSVGEANLVWEVGFPVAAGVTVEAPFETRDLPATLTAVHVHRGPLEELGPAWGSLIGWVTSKGYTPAGPAMQVFKGDFTATTEVEMRIPVQK